MRLVFGLGLCLVSLLSFAAESTVFRNVSVIAMDGSGLVAGRDVVVRGDAIVSVGPHVAGAAFGDAQVVDGSGLVLMPGLIDMHAHMPDEEDMPWPIEGYLQSYLDAGVTTIRSMRGHPQQLMWRAQVLDGSLVGPHMVLSAPPLRRQQAARKDFEDLVAAYGAAGYDFLKILSGFDADQYARLVAVANQAGLPITGHVPEAGVEAAVLSGMRSVEHMSDLTRIRTEYGEAALRKLAAAMRLNDVYVCPTYESFLVSKSLRESVNLIETRQVQGIPDVVVKAWAETVEKYRKRFADDPDARNVAEDFLTKQLETGRILMEENVGLLISPSQWKCLKPGAAMMREVRHFEALGMGREQILEALTVVAAQAMDLGDRVGQVRPGRRADLLLLQANPLQDLAALEQIAGVMLEGKWLPREAN